MTRSLSSALPLPLVLGIIFGGTELIIAFVRRSRGKATRVDRGSLPMLWLVIFGSLWLAIHAASAVSVARFSVSTPLASAAIALFAGGLALRWLSIVYLGRFFTIDVAIAPDHRLIDTGPYRYIRHPAYTGALLAFLGLGLSLGNTVSIIALMLPVILTFAYRIRVEEAALRVGIGQAYAAYCEHTWRLIPGLF